ncbi:amidohydrolase family protein [Thermopolyspora sp. NPDC052614]|uniref:amidohydrolase family protein n=1 Tax=Thermopolyspora sp. NPDC052614 TaxID=3155682 RepID=UPI0034321DDC
MRVLITGGTVLDTEPEPHVLPGADVLIDGELIVAVEPGLRDDPRAEGAEVIDATGRIVLPGFVDTHRHVWQGLLRGTAADATLGEYLDRVLGCYGTAHRPDDVYAGSLWGALDALDAGVTTQYDWSHIQLTPEHTDAAVAALRDSGVRAVFGYAHPATADPDRRESELRRLRAEHFPSAEPGLITPALAEWGGPETIEADWRLARELGMHISLHAVGQGPVEQLHAAGLLGPDLLFVHCNGFTDEALKLLADSGGTASVSPAVELQVGLGTPETGRLRAHGIPTGLSVDTITNVPGDLFSVMRAAFAAERARNLAESGTGAAPEPIRAAEVLRMATIEGAAAIGLADRVGSLRPGKQADVILLDAEALNIAPVHDPVAAVVTTADRGNVDTVLVAGRVLKRSGRLLHADVTAARDAATRAAVHVTA